MKWPRRLRHRMAASLRALRRSSPLRRGSNKIRHQPGFITEYNYYLLKLFQDFYWLLFFIKCISCEMKRNKKLYIVVLYLSWKTLSKSNILVFLNRETHAVSLLVMRRFEELKLTIVKQSKVLEVKFSNLLISFRAS